MADEAETASFRAKTREVLAGRVKPMVRHKRTDDQALLRRKNHLGLFGLGATDLPREPGRVVQGSFGGTSIDVDKNRPVLEFGRCSAITSDDFLRMHDAKIVTPSTADGIG